MLANWLTGGDAGVCSVGDGVGFEDWSGAWRPVWAGSCERNVESC